VMGQPKGADPGDFAESRQEWLRHMERENPRAGRARARPLERHFRLRGLGRQSLMRKSGSFAAALKGMVYHLVAPQMVNERVNDQ
jgi:hypothetical protein